jgi:hypothetical protein
VNELTSSTEQPLEQIHQLPDVKSHYTVHPQPPPVPATTPGGNSSYASTNIIYSKTNLSNVFAFHVVFNNQCCGSTYLFYDSGSKFVFALAPTYCKASQRISHLSSDFLIETLMRKVKNLPIVFYVFRFGAVAIGSVVNRISIFKKALTSKSGA